MLYTFQCAKRHELKKGETVNAKIKFCPWFAKQGTCLDKTCKYIHTRKEIKRKTEHIPQDETEKLKPENDRIRYFIPHESSSDTLEADQGKEKIIKEKSNLSNLPSYIPL